MPNGKVLDGTRPVNPAAAMVFRAMGMACEDVAAVMLVYDKMGATLELRSDGGIVNGNQ